MPWKNALLLCASEPVHVPSRINGDGANSYKLCMCVGGTLVIGRAGRVLEITMATVFDSITAPDTTDQECSLKGVWYFPGFCFG